ncbi:hypothetical protein HDU67_001492 [Dinochytrium kinnereticum]|nr:hypothetical protein HDU67_001492 [Dinochytrium kinnereticum]
MTYYHKKTAYPAGAVGSVPEEDITYKKVHASGHSGVAGAKLGERIRALADRRKRRSRIRVRV